MLLHQINVLNEQINQSHIVVDLDSKSKSNSNLNTTIWALYSNGTITYQGKWTCDAVFKYTLAFDSVVTLNAANAHFHFPKTVAGELTTSYCILPSRSLCEDFRHQMEQLLKQLKK